MNLQKSPELLKFLNVAIMDADSENDLKIAEEYANSINIQTRERIYTQIQVLMETDPAPLDELGTESNRWFGDGDEAIAWLRSLQSCFGGMSGSSELELIVKDSNGAVLLEGDSVTVIKDLKVKGGSSDLKRGTLVKKIHLTSDPDLVECRVDGSTLVLRTEFLKKS